MELIDRGFFFNRIVEKSAKKHLFRKSRLVAVFKFQLGLFLQKIIFKIFAVKSCFLRKINRRTVKMWLNSPLLLFEVEK